MFAQRAPYLKRYEGTADRHDMESDAAASRE